jgi:hypothetical protein
MSFTPAQYAAMCSPRLTGDDLRAALERLRRVEDTNFVPLPDTAPVIDKALLCEFRRPTRTRVSNLVEVRGDDKQGNKNAVLGFFDHKKIHGLIKDIQRITRFELWMIEGRDSKVQVHLCIEGARPSTYKRWFTGVAFETVTSMERPIRSKMRILPVPSATVMKVWKQEKAAQSKPKIVVSKEQRAFERAMNAESERGGYV